MNVPGSNQCSTRPHSSVSKMPVKKGGTAITTWPSMVRKRSSHPPGREAANSPTGRETTTIITKAMPVSSAVTPNLPSSSWDTGMA